MKKRTHTLLTLVLIAVIVSLAAYTYLALQEAKGVYTGETTISISGEGEAFARPDVGLFSFSVRAEGENAVVAQDNSAKAINAILEYLEEKGVAEKDIKTQNYNLNPKYTYEERACPLGSYCPPGERVIDGYEVSQTVSVKVRDLDQAPELISGAGENGATDISSLQFTIDDETALQAQARAEAIADAKEKAQTLANDLGLKLDRIVGFYENEGGGYPMMERSVMAMDSEMDGGFKATAPSLPVGENEIKSTVTITYQLK